MKKKIAKWFGSKYAVAVDCCTLGIELCLRLYNISVITVPKRTYLSVPFLADKPIKIIKYEFKVNIILYVSNVIMLKIEVL